MYSLDISEFCCLFLYRQMLEEASSFTRALGARIRGNGDGVDGRASVE